MTVQQLVLNKADAPDWLIERDLAMVIVVQLVCSANGARPVDTVGHVEGEALLRTEVPVC